MSRTKIPPGEVRDVLAREVRPGVLASGALINLRRLLRIRMDQERSMNAIAIRLMDRCIVACIEDARNAGASERAREVIRDVTRCGR